MQIFTSPKQPLTQKVIVGRPKLWWNANFHVAQATLNAKSDRRTPETVVKCKFSGSSRNPLVASCSSDVQNCGEMQLSYVVRATLSSLRAGRTSETVVKRWFFYAAGDCRRHALISYIFVHAAVAKRTFWSFGCHAAVAKRAFWFCRMNPLVGFGGSIARNCGETQILSSWNCSAHWPGRVNVCVLYLQDGSAHSICYHNLLNMVVPENLPRG